MHPINAQLLQTDPGGVTKCQHFLACTPGLSHDYLVDADIKLKIYFHFPAPNYRFLNTMRLQYYTYHVIIIRGGMAISKYEEIVCFVTSV